MSAARARAACALSGGGRAHAGTARRAGGDGASGAVCALPADVRARKTRFWAVFWYQSVVFWAVLSGFFGDQFNG